MLSLRPGARRLGWLSVLLTLCLTLCSSLALAQIGGTIRGEVRDPDARVMARVQIELRNSATGATIRTRTSAAGRYSFASLPAGTYDVLVAPDGFTLAPFARAGVRVEAGQTVAIDIRLQWGGNLGTPGDDQSRFYLGLADPPAGPAPRTRQGRPDFTGVWIGTLSERFSGSDGKPEEPALLPWAEALVKERIGNELRDHPNAFCLPGAVIPGGPLIFQIVQTDAAMVTLFENVPNYRQVYLDGRLHPKEPNPSWMGHSVGRWEGNTLVIDTVGFNDKSWVEIFPHTEKLHVVERYTRPDRGHLRIEVTMEDAGTFVRPWRTHATWTLAPGHEVFEYVCAENNRMMPRTVGN
jgi:carboxypeptidase family protein